jgi:hypothetical protein
MLQDLGLVLARESEHLLALVQVEWVPVVLWAQLELGLGSSLVESVWVAQVVPTLVQLLVQLGQGHGLRLQVVGPQEEQVQVRVELEGQV